MFTAHPFVNVFILFVLLYTIYAVIDRVGDTLIDMIVRRLRR